MKGFPFSVASVALVTLVTLGQAQETSFVVILMDDVGTDFLAPFDACNPYRRDLPYDPQTTGQGDEPGNGPGTSNLYAHTPNLAALAAAGVTFLDAYAQPMCSPTRAALLTGCHPSRTGVGDILEPEWLGALREFNDAGFELPTLPDLVHAAGLSDAIFGKWHLGMATPDMGPNVGSSCDTGWSTIPARGHFTHWSCVFNGVDSFPRPSDAPGYSHFYVNRGYTDHADVIANGEVIGEYATELQFQEALSWCNAQTGPFFCFVSLNAAHAPWGELPPPGTVATEEYTTAPVNVFKLYMAMLEALDFGLGQFVDGLDPAVAASTTILVLGDNGTPEVVLEHARALVTTNGSVGSAKNLGATYDLLLGTPAQTDGRFKGSAYEKGTRVPLIVAGAGVLSPGRTSRALVQVEDVFPTLAECLALDPGPVDGISFRPILRDELGDAEHARQWTWTERFRPTGAAGEGTPLDLRRIGCSQRVPGVGRFKVVRAEPGNGDELYQLEDALGLPVDPFETAPLAYAEGDPWRAAYLAVLARMDATLALGSAVAAGVETYEYCPSSENSTGERGRIASRGTLSVQRNDFGLVVVGARPNQFGLVFHGAAKELHPFGDGTRCVAAPLVRLDPVLVPAVGPLCFDLPLVGELAPDATRHFQFWYRDPGGPGGTGFNLTNGLTATFVP